MIICIIGPSGSGKSTRVLNYLKNHKDKANIIISDTTRPKRAGEEDGREYNFLTLKEFKKREHIETIIYNNHSYGIPKEELEKKLKEAPVSFVICDAEGYRLLLSRYGHNYVKSIFMRIPSSICIYNLFKREKDADKVKRRVFYDCSIDAYTMDDMINFDRIINYSGTYQELDETFEKYVQELYEEYLEQIKEYRQNL